MSWGPGRSSGPRGSRRRQRSSSTLTSSRSVSQSVSQGCIKFLIPTLPLLWKILIISPWGGGGNIKSVLILLNFLITGEDNQKREQNGWGENIKFYELYTPLQSTLFKQTWLSENLCLMSTRRSISDDTQCI